MAERIRGLLGRLPPEPERPRLSLAPIVGLPMPPIEVHNLELIPDPDMLGNDKWGDCVFAAIENDRRCSRAALGLPLNKVSASQVVATYKSYTGVSTPPGPGAVVQRALEWVRRNGWPGSYDRLLAFGDPHVGILPIDQMVAEFHSGIFGTEIDAAQEYPASLWDAVPSPYRGGHAIAAGTYTPIYTMAKTWGYIASMTPAYVAGKMGEVWATVWDFEWNSLSYERQTQIIADLAALTGDPWNGPAPVTPYEPRTAMSTVFFTPTRVLDTRTTGQPLQPGEDRVVQIAYVGPVPANAVGIAGNLTFVSPTATGNVAVTPTRYVGPSSTVNFVRGQAPDPNGFDCGLAPGGTLSLHNDSKGTVHILLDVTRADIP
jgi:hypothetical protein